VPSTSYKMLSHILLSRLSLYIDEIIGDHQCGFRRNRSKSCLPVGATTPGEPWPPLQPVSTVRFLNTFFSYRIGLLAPCPIPILEDQGVFLSLDSTL
jgi:hypothetical protein